MATQGFELPSTIKRTYEEMAQLIGNGAASGCQLDAESTRRMVELTRHLAKLKAAHQQNGEDSFGLESEADPFG